MPTTDYTYIAGLVTRAQHGDSDAFAELYAMTYENVYSYSYRYLKDAHLAQDAMQEVYILALKNINKIRDASLFVAWLRQINFNVCYDMSKRYHKVDEYVSDEFLEFIVDDNENSNPEHNAQKSDEHRRLMAAIEELPFLERQAITLRYIHDRKVDDVAKIMDVSRSSAKRYIAAGTERLRKELTR